MPCARWPFTFKVPATPLYSQRGRSSFAHSQRVKPISLGTVHLVYTEPREAGQWVFPGKGLFLV